MNFFTVLAGCIKGNWTYRRARRKGDGLKMDHIHGEFAAKYGPYCEAHPRLYWIASKSAKVPRILLNLPMLPVIALLTIVNVLHLALERIGEALDAFLNWWLLR